MTPFAKLKKRWPVRRRWRSLVRARLARRPWRTKSQTQGPRSYLDLISRSDRDKLTDPELFLRDHEDKLVILDEIHRMPQLFQTLRGLID